MNSGFVLFAKLENFINYFLILDQQGFATK